MIYISSISCVYLWLVEHPFHPLRTKYLCTTLLLLGVLQLVSDCYLSSWCLSFASSVLPPSFEAYFFLLVATCVSSDHHQVFFLLHVTSLVFPHLSFTVLTIMTLSVVQYSSTVCMSICVLASLIKSTQYSCNMS